MKTKRKDKTSVAGQTRTGGHSNEYPTKPRTSKAEVRATGSLKSKPATSLPLKQVTGCAPRYSVRNKGLNAYWVGKDTI